MIYSPSDFHVLDYHTTHAYLLALQEAINQSYKKNTIILFVSLQNCAYALFPVSQKKIKTMLVQTFGRANKEYYGIFDMIG